MALAVGSADFVDWLEVGSVWASFVQVALHFALLGALILSLAVNSGNEVPEALGASARSQEVGCSHSS